MLTREQFIKTCTAYGCRLEQAEELFSLALDAQPPSTPAEKPVEPVGYVRPDFREAQKIGDVFLFAPWERDVGDVPLYIAPPEKPVEPDYWPSVKVIIGEDDSVTATLYAPGLPPGEYDMYLPASPCVAPPESEQVALRDALTDDEIDEWTQTIATYNVYGWTLTGHEQIRRFARAIARAALKAKE